MYLCDCIGWVESFPLDVVSPLYWQSTCGALARTRDGHL